MISPKTRKLAHGKNCPYCNKLMHLEPISRVSPKHYEPTKEHVFPSSKGGKIVIIICSECNSEKGNMDPSKWLFHCYFFNRKKYLISLNTFINIKGILVEYACEKKITNCLEQMQKPIQTYKKLTRRGRI